MPSSARRTAPGPCARLQAVRERWSSMQPARSARHAGPARRRRSARSVRRLVLLAIALLALALVLSPLGLGLARRDDGGGDAGPGVQVFNDCNHRNTYFTDGTGAVLVCPWRPTNSPGGQSGNDVTPDS